MKSYTTRQLMFGVVHDRAGQVILPFHISKEHVKQAGRNDNY